MNKKSSLITLFGWMILGMLALTACLPAVITQSPDAIYTQAAATISAQMTLQAGATAVARLTQIAAQPTPTLALLPTQTSTATLIPPSPTATQAPVLPTATAVRCNAVEFVRDVSIPDGARLRPEEVFTKTWRLRNAGACTWSRDYSLVFVQGDRMGGAAELAFGVDVRPGQVADISVVLRAPIQAGGYTGFWMLRDNNGALFGVGSDAVTPFSVRIEVTAARQVVYDMVENYCTAVWSTNTGVRSCPSSDINTANGFIVRVDTPQLENGVVENEPALFVLPDASANGFISGRYPAFPIRSGDRFTAWIGCGYNNQKCDATFALFYSADGGAFQSLGEWRERNEGESASLEIDLSFLANRSVVFILTVFNNGDSTDDVAYWFAPRIVR
jgi:hypothetical protein